MQIFALAVQQTVHAEAAFHVGARQCLPVRRQFRQALPEQGIRAAHQPQRRQHGGGFAVGAVNTRFAAPFRGVIHARQVVEEQRSGVKIFDGDRQVFRAGFGQAVGPGHFVDEACAHQAAGMIQGLPQRAGQMRLGCRRQRQIGGKRRRQITGAARAAGKNGFGCGHEAGQGYFPAGNFPAKWKLTCNWGSTVSTNSLRILGSLKSR